MTAQLRQKKYTFDEYLVLEEQADFKHEYLNGKITPIAIGVAGASLFHQRIITSLIIALGALLDDEIYDILGSDLKTYSKKYNKSRYPDVFVIKGEAEFYNTKTQSVVINPLIVFEVLSKSTAKADKNEKFDEYKSLATFEEYVLVEQKKAEVTVYTKAVDDTWTAKTTTDLNENIQLRTLGVEIPMQRIYRKIKFEQ